MVYAQGQVLVAVLFSIPIKCLTVEMERKTVPSASLQKTLKRGCDRKKRWSAVGRDIRRVLQMGWHSPLFYTVSEGTGWGAEVLKGTWGFQWMPDWIKSHTANKTCWFALGSALAVDWGKICQPLFPVGRFMLSSKGNVVMAFLKILGQLQRWWSWALLNRSRESVRRGQFWLGRFLLHIRNFSARRAGQ